MLPYRLLSFSLLGSIIASEIRSSIKSNTDNPTDHSNSSLKDRDAHDADRLGVIDQSLTDVYQSLPDESKQVTPLEIAGMIEGYDYDGPLYELYNKIMDQLSVSMKKEDYWIFIARIL